MPTTVFTFDSGMEGWRGWNPLTNTYQNSLIGYDAAGDRLGMSRSLLKL